MNRSSLAVERGPLLEVRGLDLETPASRPLIRRLSLTLGCERVAIIGRNGAGKSSLLAVLAGEEQAAHGYVMRRGSVLLVAQRLRPGGTAAAVEALERAVRQRGAGVIDSKLAAAGLPPLASLAAAAELSAGEQRKLLLCHAEIVRPDLLLLDEPTQDLDEAGSKWLQGWLAGWDRAALVVSHDRSLLRLFGAFMLIAESGCRYLGGDFAVVEQQIIQAEDARQRSYARQLNFLLQKEHHSEQFRKRRARKKNVGRIRELGRHTPRVRLNQKRSYAQEKQARIEGVRQDRISQMRAWAKAARRDLAVSLPITEVMPRLGPAPEGDIVVIENLAANAGGRRLFSGLDLRLGRDRVAITGANGTGKTTLLRTLLGEHPAAEGRVRTQHDRVGAIAQGATDWISEESLLERLGLTTRGQSIEALGALLGAHRFPLALATRPLASLSPGERFRAALICLLEQNPPLEVLVLDEPTYGLDFVGLAAVRALLRAWPGGLVIVSHERGILEEIGIERWICLDDPAFLPFDRVDVGDTSRSADKW